MRRRQGGQQHCSLHPAVPWLSFDFLTLNNQSKLYMSKSFTGGCACGAVRYECTAKPVAMIKCHCRECQRVTGGGFACAVLVPADSFNLTRGTPKYHFNTSAKGGQHKRGFCAECGSPLTGAENTERSTGVVGVLAASLDDPSLFRPQMEIWTADAQPWDRLDPNLPSYEQYPPS